MPADPVSQLSTAIDVVAQVIDGVRADQWDAPTPCPDWRVRDLVGHLAAGNALFARAVRGGSAAPPGGAGEPDPVRAYAESAAAVLSAFREPGALERVVTVPIGAVPGIAALHLRITELLVHGWDLARATGQQVEFPGDLAEQELAFSGGKLADIPPGRTPFAPPRPVANDAAPIDRLAALLGRDVAAPVADVGGGA